MLVVICISPPSSVCLVGLMVPCPGDIMVYIAIENVMQQPIGENSSRQSKNESERDVSLPSELCERGFLERKRLEMNEFKAHTTPKMGDNSKQRLIAHWMPDYSLHATFVWRCKIAPIVSPAVCVFSLKSLQYITKYRSLSRSHAQHKKVNSHTLEKKKNRSKGASDPLTM